MKQTVTIEGTVEVEEHPELGQPDVDADDLVDELGDFFAVDEHTVTATFEVEVEEVDE